jgi:alpha-D-xyloside xylohydrolase
VAPVLWTELAKRLEERSGFKVNRGTGGFGRRRFIAGSVGLLAAAKTALPQQNAYSDGNFAGGPITGPFRPNWESLRAYLAGGKLESRGTDPALRQNHAYVFKINPLGARLMRLTFQSILVLVLMPALFPWSAFAAPQGQGSTERGLAVQSDCGNLSVVPIADGALRVRCAPASTVAPASLVLLHQATNVPFSVHRNEASISLTTSRLTATFDRKAGVLRFSDAKGRLLLEELPGGRSVRPSSVQGQPTLIAEDRFRSPADEHIFGSGQFQDGFLDIRDLPRRLTQVNTQISIPFLFSSKGYGLLWHNYGLTDLNPTDNRLALMRETLGNTTSDAVTTTEGTRTVGRTAAVFIGDFEAGASGRYAMMLDVGQSMARRYHVEIDGTTVVDLTNGWLPPTTSWFLELKAGKHHVRVEGGMNDKPSLSWRPSAPETALRSPVSDGIDYVVFAGSTGDEIIAAYRKVTGEVPLFPLWAYGFIQCRERYTSSDDILENAREFRARKLPMDVMVQDWQYWGKYGWNAMQWDEAHYPDPAALVRQLHQQLHAELMVSVWSRIEPNSTVGKQFAERNFFLPGTQWVDFFNPEARALYWKNFSSRMLSLGIDAWWQDATEPENDALAGQTTFAGPGDRFRLIYPLLVTKTVYEGQRKDAPDKRVFILTRSAFLGEQQYAAAVWSGDIGNDWETFRRQVAAGLNYCVTGLPYWTTDAGGFFRPRVGQYTDTAYHERFLRWLQFAAFSPLMRVHGFQTNTEPWRYGSEVEAEARQYLEMRYRLLPYIYSQAAEITFRGSTLMRPLVMDFRGDERALTQNHEYMFGPSLLVAPVLQPGVQEWPVYAPATPGGWFDWWTEKKVSGGNTTALDAPLAKIPLLVRAGSIIPLGPVQQYTGEDRSGELELRIYPGADGTFTLYEDEGVNYAYENGARATISFRWDDGLHALSIGKRKGAYPGMIANRQFTVHLAGTSASSDKRVQYAGRKLSLTLK